MSRVAKFDQKKIIEMRKKGKKLRDIATEIGCSFQWVKSVTRMDDYKEKKKQLQTIKHRMDKCPSCGKTFEVSYETKSYCSNECFEKSL